MTAGPLAVHAGPPPTVPDPVLRGEWPARLDCKAEAIDRLAGELLARGWVAADEREWLYLCLDEALVNAMLHGNEGDPGLMVRAELGSDGRSWVVAVHDRGEGFDPATLPDPEDPASLLAEHGRGIRLMREWLDELTYWQGGACAWMARRRSDLDRG